MTSRCCGEEKPVILDFGPQNSVAGTMPMIALISCSGVVILTLVELVCVAVVVVVAVQKTRKERALFGSSILSCLNPHSGSHSNLQISNRAC